jgi:hypothetical protein
MALNEDIRWKQRFQNFDRVFVLLRAATGVITQRIQRARTGRYYSTYLQTGLENHERLSASQWHSDYCPLPRGK